MVDPAMLLGLLPDSLATLDPTARTIVTAARTCFTERGFSNTTMQDIADAAGVGVATVYRRFRHKRNLVRLTIIDESVRLSTLISDVAAARRAPKKASLRCSPRSSTKRRPQAADPQHPGIARGRRAVRVPDRRASDRHLAHLHRELVAPLAGAR